MKRLFCLLLILSVESAGINADRTGSVNDIEVYVCTGTQSKRYHKRYTCRGLKSCSKEVIKVSLQKAKDMGRTPCGYCYK